MGEAAKLPASAASLSAAGWLNVPVSNGKGIIVQWGRFLSMTSATEMVFNLPVAFPNGIFAAVAAHDAASQYTRPTVYAVSLSGLSKITASATVLNAQTEGGSVTRGSNGSACYGFYIVIGY